MKGTFQRNNPMRARVLRGQILSVCYLAAMEGTVNPDDPWALGAGVLTTTLEYNKTLPNEAELHAALRYLEEKKYLEVMWTKDGSGGFDWVRITPSGVDLCEGTSKDPAVFIPERR